MFKRKQLDNILFLDIETVSENPSYSDLSDEGKALWDKKFQSINKYSNVSEGMLSDEGYGEKAGIFAEFGKVVCISIGYIKLGSTMTMRLKSIYGDDEKEVLHKFAAILDRYFDNPKKDFICGHNIKEFDIPFLCRRMLVHGITFPNLLDISAKKPWQVEHLVDTMHLWKFGDYKHYTSLRLLAHLFSIPSPKDDIDGSEVSKVYHEEGDLKRIAIYCEKDVVTVAKLLLKWNGVPIEDINIENADDE